MQKYGSPEPIRPDEDQAQTQEGIAKQAGLQPGQDLWTAGDSAELAQENAPDRQQG